MTRKAAIAAALAVLASCRDRGPAPPPSAPTPRAADLFARAFEADEAKKPRDAERLYREALAAHAHTADPGTAFRARFNLGTLLMREHRYDDARDELVQATKLLPMDFAAFYNLGLCEAAALRDKEAIFPLMQAVSLDATHAGARYNLGFVLWRIGRREEARMHLQIAANQQPALKSSVDRLLGDKPPPPALPPTVPPAPH